MRGGEKLVQDERLMRAIVGRAFQGSRVGEGS